MYPSIKLKSGREVSASYHHPWVFSGAIDVLPQALLSGDLVRVEAHDGRILGVGSYSSQSMIAVRLWDFTDVEITPAWLKLQLEQAYARRLQAGFGPTTPTTAYRVVFGEVDGLPGLVLDRYADVWVMQISTAAMERFRPTLIDVIRELFAPRAIVERSDIGVRQEEGLLQEQGIRWGELEGGVRIMENQHPFVVDPLQGQKTGFFLDQKVLRQRIELLAAGKKVLNLFSYTGATSIYALYGGASEVMNVDSSEWALSQSLSESARNGFEGRVSTLCTDIFQWLDRGPAATYGMVIMDPPALIKSQHDLEAGKKAYHFLNRAALRLVEDNGIFVTSSCSHFLPQSELELIVRRASLQAGVTLELVDIVAQAPDHPRSLYFSEGTYLKSLICRVRRPLAS